MSRAHVIARRELNSYFYSPIAYVAMALFLLAGGLLFRNDFEPGQPATMRNIFFDWMLWLLVFIIPILSMGLLSQEWSSGTIETLMTAPLNEWDVVLGKFFGSLAFFVVMLAPTMLYVALLRMYGMPDYWPILNGYLGILLAGALFISIGLFCSSLTRSQVVAAVLTASILCLITVLPWWVRSSVAMQGRLRTLADQGVFSRYSDFSRGILDFGNLTFFVLSTAVFLFLTAKVLESRRWK